MVDNLFVVESPLQALVAVELSLQFEGQTNGIIYRLSEQRRHRNNEQIISVIALGNWSFSEQIKFSESSGIFWHINMRKCMSELRKRFRNNVRNLFFGEFRSQWMHFARLTIEPEKFVLMDDGAATLTAKSRYIDQGIFYPSELWASKKPIKNFVKSTIYLGMFNAFQARRPVTFASAFLKDESEFRVDFSSTRQKVANRNSFACPVSPKAYFFGSKYSEAGILSRDYELDFISKVFRHYEEKGLDLVYCAHRDESDEKIELIGALGPIEVVRPELPAELFVIEHDRAISEIGAAYSSVVNNLSLMFPDKPLTSFRLNHEAINPVNREAIDDIYRYFAQKEIRVETF